MKNLSYRTKNKLLLIAFVVLSWASYSFALKETFGAYQKCNRLEEQMVNASNASSNISQLQEKIAVLESSIGGLYKNNEDKKETLLDVISNYCQNHHLILRDIPKTIENISGDYLLETNVFTVEGGFKQVNDLVYIIEHEKHISNVGSVRYFIKTDPRMKARNLLATIYLQNVKKK